MVFGIKTDSSTASKQPTPSAKSPADSESDATTYGGSRRGLTAKKQQRRLLQSALDPSPSHAELRFSTRRAARVSNYNEDDDDEFNEEDDDELHPDNQAANPNVNTPMIDIILNHRLREGVGELDLVNMI